MFTRHRIRTRTFGGAMIAAAMLATALAGSALAGGKGATIVRGIQLAAGSCANGGYAMTGALEGCWWIDTFETTSDPDKSHYVATGTEHFTGRLGSAFGTFTTTYRFTAKTDGPWPTSAEIHGRCHHPVTGGTGDFTGASGEISFHDVVDVSPPFYPYWGSLRLAAGSGGATLTVNRLAATASTSGTTC